LSTDAAAEPLIADILHSGVEWRRLHRQLDHLRTATPRSPGVQRDVQRVQSLLLDHIPLHVTQHNAEPVAGDRQLITTMLEALRSLNAMAGWNAQVFNDLAASRQIYIDGPKLTGDEATNDNQLVAAKLHAGLVPLPPDRLVAVRDAYRSRRAHSTRFEQCSLPVWPQVSPRW
jgi:hypothetical protein